MEQPQSIDFNLIIQELGAKNLEIILLRNQVQVLAAKIAELEKSKDASE